MSRYGNPKQTSPVTSVPVSVAQGGTGATDAAGARTGLGLGTAATKDTGTTNGTVPLVGVGDTLAASVIPSHTHSGGDVTSAVANATAAADGVTSASGTAPLTLTLAAKAITGSVAAMTGDSGAGGAAGTVPAPAAGDAAAGKFLKADATWAAPATGGPTVNVQALTADKTLTAGTDKNYQYLTPDAAGRTVTIADSGTEGAWFTIRNCQGFVGASFNVVLKGTSDASMYLWPGQIATFIYDGSSWQAGSNAAQQSADLANSNSVFNTVLGTTARVEGGGTAIGYGSVSRAGVAVGMSASESTYTGQSVSIGSSTQANAYYSTAVGSSATANSNRSIAIGYYTSASEQYATAVGFQAAASTKWSIANGAGSLADKYGEDARTIDGTDGWGATRYKTSNFGYAGETTNATPTELFLMKQASNRLTITASSALAFRANVIAYCNAGRKAVGTITMSGLPVADETFVIGAQTFTWKASRSVAGEVTIGADAAGCVTNIVTAVTADIATVTAADGAGDTVVVTAATAGAAGNSIVFTESSTNMAVDGTGTLGGTLAGIDNPGISWRVEGAIKRDASNNTVLVGTVVKTKLSEDGTTSYDVALTADDTNEALAVTVTGAANETVRWAVKLETTEVRF